MVPARNRLVAMPATGSGDHSEFPRYRMDGGNVTIAPSFQCLQERTKGYSISMGYDAAWAQRETAGHGVLMFDLLFDRNTWLPALTASWKGHLFKSPGLAYPNPSEQQLQWLMYDLQNDLKDACGDGEPEPRSWGIRILRVESNGTVQTGKAKESDFSQNGMSHLGPSTDCASGVVLPMRISVAVHVPPPNAANGSSVADAKHLIQRSRAAGSMLQQLVGKLRNQRPQIRLSTWLLAVDPASIRFWVELPCIPASGKKRAHDCTIDGERWASQSLHAAEIAISAISIIALISGASYQLCSKPSCCMTAKDPKADNMELPTLQIDERNDEQLHEAAGENTFDSTTDIIEGGGLRPADKETVHWAERRADSLDGSQSLMDGGCCASPIDWVPVYATLRTVWYWMMVPALMYAECSIPAMVLAVGLCIVAISRAVMVLVLGHDLVSIVGQQFSQTHDDACRCLPCGPECAESCNCIRSSSQCCLDRNARHQVGEEAMSMHDNARQRSTPRLQSYTRNNSLNSNQSIDDVQGGDGSSQLKPRMSPKTSRWR